MALTEGSSTVVPSDAPTCPQLPCQLSVVVLRLRKRKFPALVRTTTAIWLAPTNTAAGIPMSPPDGVPLVVVHEDRVCAFELYLRKATCEQFRGNMYKGSKAGEDT